MYGLEVGPEEMQRDILILPVWRGSGDREHVGHGVVDRRGKTHPCLEGPILAKRDEVVIISHSDDPCRIIEPYAGALHIRQPLLESRIGAIGSGVIVCQSQP